MSSILSDMVGYLEGDALDYAVRDLFKKPDSLAYAAGDPNTPAWLLDKLAREGGAKIAILVSRNPSAADETVEFLTHSAKVTVRENALISQQHRKAAKARNREEKKDTANALAVYDSVSKIAKNARTPLERQTNRDELIENFVTELQKYVAAGGKVDTNVFGAWEHLGSDEIAAACARADLAAGGENWPGEAEELLRVALYELEEELDYSHQNYPIDLDTSDHAKTLKEKLGRIKEATRLLNGTLIGKQTTMMARITGEETSDEKLLALLAGKPSELRRAMAILAYTRPGAGAQVLEAAERLNKEALPPGALRLSEGYGTREHALRVIGEKPAQAVFEMLTDESHNWEDLVGKEAIEYGLRRAVENLDWIEYYSPTASVSNYLSEELVKAMIVEATSEVYEWLFAAVKNREWLHVGASYNPNMRSRRCSENLWSAVRSEDIPKMSVQSLLEVTGNKMRTSEGRAARGVALSMLAESTGGDLGAALALDGTAETFPGSIEDLKNFITEAARQTVKQPEKRTGADEKNAEPKRRSGPRPSRKTGPANTVTA